MKTVEEKIEVELNGVCITPEDVRQYLGAKKVSLWSDWCIGRPDAMDSAVEWFMSQMSGLAASVV